MANRVEDGVLAGALEYWKSVNLTTLLRGLDQTGLTIVENQKTSLQERRRLAEKTKAFRSIPDEQKAQEFKPLLRAYQNEIDSLTKRMKFAETAFLSIFKSLSDAPDPEPFLAGLLEERKANDLNASVRDELDKAKAKADTLAEENLKLREQARDSQQLREQVDEFEKKLKTMVDEQVSLREKELKDENGELIRHLKEREGDLQHQLSASNRQLAQLQATHDSEQAERAELSLSADRELIVKLAEHDILQSDLDHANGRLADLQAQNARLRAELSSITGGTASGADGKGGVAETLAEYRRRVRDLEEETERLFANLEKSDAELRHQESKLRAEMAGVEREAAAKDEEVRRLREELGRRRDYDEVKRDLEIMKSVEFAVSDWGMGEDEDQEDGADGSESLEKLLVKRNKALENRLTDARNQLEGCRAELRESLDKCKALEEGLAEKTKLAERLEADLLTVQPASPTGAASQQPPDAGGRGNAESVEMKPLGRSSDGGLLGIVTGQRDRFRQRNIELEDELRVQASSVSDLRRQVDQVKQDNLRLYEEIKYLRSYASSSGSTVLGTDTAVISMPSKFSSRNGRVDMDMGVGAKYKGMYEESLNPFNVFHRSETSRRVRSMGLVDRLIYMFSNFVMGNRKARLALLVYVGLLHLLVLVTLYRSVLLADATPHEPI
ncbi:hypothetical protein GQ54DRAFT_249495, partial [Martensiomyces pterosporus]